MTATIKEVPNLLHFYEKVQVGPGCWNWLGCKSDRGYGTIHWGWKEGKRAKRAHVLSYELIYGPVPVGLEVHHECNNRSCVNPVHLEAVTHYENCRRRPAAPPKQYCPVGHDTFVVGRYKGACVECRRVRSREFMRGYKKRRREQLDHDSAIVS